MNNGKPGHASEYSGTLVTRGVYMVTPRPPRPEQRGVSEVYVKCTSLYHEMKP